MGFGQRLSERLSVIGASVILVSIWLVGAGKEFWFDERFIQVVSQLSWTSMFQVLRFENNPPFLFSLIHIWQGLVGSNEAWLRLMTLLPSLATVALLPRLAKRLGSSVGWTAMLAATSGLVVMQAGELRMYPWVMLLTTLALLGAWDYSEAPRRTTLAWLGLVLMIGNLTHYTFVFVSAFVVGWLILNRRQQWREMMVFGAAVVAAFLPWAIYSLWPKLQDLSANVGIQRIAAERFEAAYLPFRFIVPPWFLEEPIWGVLRFLAVVLIVTAMVMWVIDGLRRRLPKDFRFLGSFLLVVGGLLILTGIVVPKYASSLIPAILLIVVAGLTRLPASRLAKVAALVCVVIVAAGTSLQQARLPYVTYQESAKIVEANERPGDVLLVYPFNDEIAVRPYYQGRLAVQGFFPLRDRGQVPLVDIVRYNFRVSLTSDNIDRLATYVQDARRVWFFFDVPPSPGYWHGDLIIDWFRRNGYRPSLYSGAFHNVPPLLMRFDRQALTT